MLETNKIYCMDCLEGLKLIDNNSIDFVLTDPPYNVGLDYSEIDDNMDDEEYGIWCLQWIKELYRILKDGHFCIIFTGDLKIYWILRAIYKTPFKYHHMLKWHKPNCHRALSGTVFFNNTELAFVLTKNKANLDNINRKEMYNDTLSYNNTNRNIPEDGMIIEHPASRPSGLYIQIIKGFTQEGQLVLDCFMGSGTTANACKKINRCFIGFEISQHYVDIANKRLQQETVQKWFKTD